MKSNDKLMRRDFARAAALGTAALALPADVLAQQQRPAPEAAKAAATPELPKLLAASQAEADGSYDLLIRKYLPAWKHRPKHTNMVARYDTLTRTVVTPPFVSPRPYAASRLED